MDVFKQIKIYALQIKQGLAYSYNGKNSLESEETRAIVSWEKLRKASSISFYEAKNMVQFFDFNVKLEKKESYNIEDVGLPKAACDQDWMAMWENSHSDEENRVWYVAATRARENLYVVRPRGFRHYVI